jgi:hypothetical protein
MRIIRSAGVVAIMAGAACAVEIEETATEPASAEEAESLVTSDTLAQCLAVASAGPIARAVFCRSLTDPSIAAQCWANLQASKIAWTNWCYWHFAG